MWTSCFSLRFFVLLFGFCIYCIYKRYIHIYVANTYKHHVLEQMYSGCATLVHNVDTLVLYALCGSRAVLLFELYLKLVSLIISFVILGPSLYLMKMTIVPTLLGYWDTFMTMCDKERYTAPDSC